MSDFEFPTNIRQIGSIGDGLRIYIEDYAYTYLKQYVEAGGYDERIALLIGRHMIIDENRVLFINGAIQGIYAEQEQGILVFSEKSMNHAYEKMQLYFRGLDIVGWMQSQPSYGVALNSNSIAYHASTFLKPDQVLFLMDPIEDLNAFYTWSTEKEALQEACGYFIYYDKNRGMQEYMLECRAKEKPALSTFRLLSKPAEHIEPKAESGTESATELGTATGTVPITKFRVEKTKGEDERTAVPVSFVKPRISGGASPIQERRLNNLLVSLSAVLVLVCFIMGAGLIQNESRISNLEDQLDQLALLTMSVHDVITNAESRTESAFAPTHMTETPDMITKENPMQDEDNYEVFGHQENTVPQAGITEQENLTSQEYPTIVLVSPTPTPEPIHNSEPVPTPIPFRDEPPVAITIPETYTIEPGDNLIYINRRFYGNTNMISQIMELNGIENPDLLHVGTTIWLPRLE